MVVNAHTGKAGELFVLRAQFLKDLTHLEFTGGSGQLVVALETDALWYLGIEFVEPHHAHLCQHRFQVVVCVREIFIIH